MVMFYITLFFYFLPYVLKAFEVGTERTYWPEFVISCWVISFACALCIGRV